jgi:hypothetical protein
MESDVCTPCRSGGKKPGTLVVFSSVTDRTEGREQVFTFCIQSDMCHLIKALKGISGADKKGSINTGSSHLFCKRKSNL